MKKRELWWGYIKQILYNTEECAAFEKDAVRKAVEKTEKMDGGAHRIKVIELVFFKKTHKLAGAALQVPCGYETAKRWQRDFIREVAKNIKCDGLTKE